MCILKPLLSNVSTKASTNGEEANQNDCEASFNTPSPQTDNIHIWSDNEITYKYSTKIASFEEEWLSLEGFDILFSYGFLKNIETNCPKDIMPIYALAYMKNTLVGLFYFQSKRVNLAHNLRSYPQKYKVNPFWQTMSNKIRHFVLNLINFNTLINGNLLVTGPYGYRFNADLSASSKTQIIQGVEKSLKNIPAFKKRTNGLHLIKDLPEQEVLTDPSSVKQYTTFCVQPKMVMHISENWHNFEDYLLDMKSKYRIRAKKALSCFTNVARRPIDDTSLYLLKEEMFLLYKSISDEAGFNAFILDKNYFIGLKESLGDNINFTGYWIDDKLIGFYTSIYNYGVLEAHFLGYDKSLNQTYYIYQNMLYDLVRMAIQAKMHTLDLSRTAIEIKSTIGAVPVQHFLMLKHNNPWLNALVKPVVNFISPKPDFTIRSPFK